MAMAPCAAASSVSSFPARPAAATTAVGPRAGGSMRAHAVAERRGAGGKWWAPLLGWSGRADYIEAPTPALPARDDAAAASRRQFMGGLTEEKARELSARMWVTDCFHDAMYHSAIASHLGRSR
ncbi:hypothetical protein EJB05_33322, partial [Eragrostis curvula]